MKAELKRQLYIGTILLAGLGLALQSGVSAAAALATLVLGYLILCSINDLE